MITELPGKKDTNNGLRINSKNNGRDLQKVYIGLKLRRFVSLELGLGK
jgi:hypothetical protein